MTRSFAGTVAAIAFATVVAAHHAPVEYEPVAVMVVEGVLSSVHWSNPHITFVLDVRGAGGRLERWEVEGNGIGQTLASGLSQQILKPGNRVTVHARRAKDRSRHEAFLVAVQFKGRTFVRRPGTEVE